MNPLDAQVEQITGLTVEQAMQIDEVNIFELLGEALFYKLSTNFYNRVFNDEEIWFRDIFKGKKIENAIQNQAEFFMQRMGGPTLYSERRGHPALIARHMPFDMSRRAADRWVHHMKLAFDDTPEIPADARDRMMKYFTHTAYFLSLGVTSRRN